MNLAETDLKRILKDRARQVDDFLTALPGIIPGTPPRLAEAMAYSLEAGGKRIRPVLCLSCAALCGLGAAATLPFACAIEMIHTYSLIHDDLPAMDNDDLRRGRPSNHKAFDEATAILAGDGLLTDAFAVACSSPLAPEPVLRALRELALAAGSPGMVGGQMLDMQYTGKKNVSLDQLRQMQALKTGAILRASCLCGAILANAARGVLERIGQYGSAIGLAFQIADDILDVTASTEELGKPAGSDEAEGKTTWPALAGLEESRRQAKIEEEKAIAALRGFDSPEADFLRALASHIVQRAA